MRNKTIRRSVDSLQLTVPAAWLCQPSSPSGTAAGGARGYILPLVNFPSFIANIAKHSCTSFPRGATSTAASVHLIYAPSAAFNTHTSHHEGEPCMGEKLASGEGLEHIARMNVEKDKVFLPDNELPEALPQEMVAAEELDEAVTSFEELDLELDDLPEAAEDAPESAVELLEASQGEDANERENDGDEYSKDDPVLLYLREMGAVPLLRPEEEVSIAQRTEQAAEEVQFLLLSSPLAAKPALWEGIRSKVDPSMPPASEHLSSPEEGSPPTLTPQER